MFELKFYIDTSKMNRSCPVLHETRQTSSWLSLIERRLSTSLPYAGLCSHGSRMPALMDTVSVKSLLTETNSSRNTKRQKNWNK